MSERYRFRQRSQQEGESIKQFVSAFRQLATNCRFGDLHDQMLRDQIIEKTTSADIREKLLMEPDTLQLSRAVQIACQIETAKREAQQITAKPQSMDSIQKVSKGFRPAPKSDSKEESQFFPPDSKSGTFFCSNCGWRNHRAGSPNCPAIGQICRLCKKKNHYARCCRSVIEEAAKEKSQPLKPEGIQKVRTVINTISVSAATGFRMCTCVAGRSSFRPYY